MKNENRFFTLSVDRLIYLAILIYFLSQTAIFFNKSGFIIGDLGREIYTPTRILSNQIPYKDFTWLYGPLPLYINAVLFKIFSVSITPLYYVSLLAGIIIAFLVFRLSKFFVPSVIALLLTLLFIKVSMFGFTWQSFILPGKFATIWATLMSLLALNSILSQTGKVSKPQELSLGILCGLVAITKIDYFFAITAASIIYLFLTPRKSQKAFIKAFVVYLTGVLTIISLTLFAFVIIEKVPFLTIAENVFPQYAAYYWFTNRQFYSLPGFLKTIKYELLTLGSVLVLSLKSRVGKYNLLSAKIVSIGLLVFMLLTFNFAAIQFTFFQPFLVMAILALIPVLLIKTVPSSSKKMLLLLTTFLLVLTLRDKFSLSAYNMILPVFVLAGSIYSLANHTAAFNKSVLTLSFATILLALFFNQSKYLAAAQYSDKTVAITGDRGGLIVEPVPSGILFQAVDEIDRISSNSATLTAFPMEASINFFSHKVNPIKHDQLVNGLISPDKQDQVIDELQTSRPSFITISNYEFLGYFGIDYNQRIYNWIISNYRLVRNFGCVAPYQTDHACTGYGLRLYRSIY